MGNTGSLGRGWAARRCKPQVFPWRLHVRAQRVQCRPSSSGRCRRRTTEHLPRERRCWVSTGSYPSETDSLRRSATAISQNTTMIKSELAKVRVSTTAAAAMLWRGDLLNGRPVGGTFLLPGRRVSFDPNRAQRYIYPLQELTLEFVSKYS